MNFIAAMAVAQGVFDQYKIDQPKWWKRMDGTPILNDVAVLMAEAFRNALAAQPATRDDAVWKRYCTLLRNEDYDAIEKLFAEIDEGARAASALAAQPASGTFRAALDEARRIAPTGQCGESAGYIQGWRDVLEFIARRYDEIAARPETGNPVSGQKQEVAAQPVTQTGVPSDATEAMTDSVRYLFTGMEMPGMTFRKIRAHCELSGMDTSHWPAWTRGRENEHFNKAARAALVWHIMYRAASPAPAKQAAVPGELTHSQAMRMNNVHVSALMEARDLISDLRVGIAVGKRDAFVAKLKRAIDYTPPPAAAPTPEVKP